MTLAEARLAPGKEEHSTRDIVTLHITLHITQCWPAEILYTLRLVSGSRVIVTLFLTADTAPSQVSPSSSSSHHCPHLWFWARVISVNSTFFVGWYFGINWQSPNLSRICKLGNLFLNEKYLASFMSLAGWNSQKWFHCPRCVMHQDLNTQTRYQKHYFEWNCDLSFVLQTSPWALITLCSTSRNGPSSSTRCSSEPCFVLLFSPIYFQVDIQNTHALDWLKILTSYQC